MQSRMSKVLYRSLKNIVKPYNNTTNYLEVREDIENLARLQRISRKVTLTCIPLENCTMELVEVPEAPKDKIVMYIHGGGFTTGSIAVSRKVITEFCLRAGLNAVSCEYRLAPEHAFPAPLDDCVAMYKHLLEMGYKGKDITLLGESAGGTLILTLTLYLKDHGIELPAAVCPMCPVGDITGTLDSRERNIKVEALLSYNIDEEIRKAYVGEHDVCDPYVSPIYGNYKDFPPIFLQLGEYEVLYDDSMLIYEMAKKSDVDVTLSVWDKMWHGFQVIWNMPEAKLAQDEIIAFMYKHLDYNILDNYRVKYE